MRPAWRLPQVASISAEKLGVCAQHVGAAPKEKARNAGDGLALRDALDNEVDGRYERPPMEDARGRPASGYADTNPRQA
jgi:hypothetical protein